MKSPFRPQFLAALNQVKWRLTLTYLLVTLATIFMLGWWGLLAGIISLQRANPNLGLVDIAREQVLPALGVILPSGLLLLIPAVLVSTYFGFLAARWLDIRLGNLRRAIRAWRRGDFSVVISDDIADEVGAFGQELNGMASELERLLQAREALAALEERGQLARDLHDSVKQQITAAAFQIEAANSLLYQNPESAGTCLDEAASLVQAAHQELNEILFELRPANPPTGNLPQALREYTERWGRQNAIRVDLRIGGEVNPGEAVRQELLRMTQEALSNVARHSHAGRVEISLAATGEGLSLSICDDGCGFDDGSIALKGLGLKTMRERAMKLGGSFAIESQPQQGTRVTVRIPQMHSMNGGDQSG